MAKFNIKISSRHLEITDEIKNYIDKKVAKFDRYVHKIPSVEFIISKEKYMYQISAVVHSYNRKVIKLSSNDKSLHSAIDILIDKIKEVLIKQKEKMQKTKKHYSKDINTYGDYPVYTRTTMQIKKLTEQQAIEEIDKLSVDMLIFYNKNTDKISVLKKTGGNIEISELKIE
ncbi:MAG: ribosome-associated translation inhibitor RaiA [Endomicrobia bacterium]|nr:ribosome-associated translation inhibitor RaiA [Endomicrobiia bacterium]MCX7940347.1 ribosome-associated translation inhibitor RaiA [Endomicrobiia bacterium]MDW8055222.1 ribosome-associated translation inhibitor RaiA [Elusimicrobiota bacterium]